ncbi:hypothetical protein [Henriciella sp.]|uniref:hypothetical protein n=1 Tax=Henriciella sp. TaxID=1968823 RepID=UPI002629E4A0|nr:hypothetical protein [Henriciella sp.]
MRLIIGYFVAIAAILLGLSAIGSQRAEAAAEPAAKPATIGEGAAKADLGMTPRPQIAVESQAI